MERKCNLIITEGFVIVNVNFKYKKRKGFYNGIERRYLEVYKDNTFVSMIDLEKYRLEFYGENSFDNIANYRIKEVEKSEKDNC